MFRQTFPVLIPTVPLIHALGEGDYTLCKYVVQMNVLNP